MEQDIRNLKASEVLELVFVYLAEVSSLRDFDEIMDTLANMGRSLTSADRCTVWVVGDDKKTIWTKVSHGMEPITLPIDSGIVGDTIMSGKRVRIDDVYKDPRFNADIDKKTGYRTKSMMVVPMYDYDENIIGAFQVINHKGVTEKFDNYDLEYLSLASTYAAESLVAARLTQEIEDTQKEVVFTMGAIGESRSKETGNHVKRVAEYSYILAIANGMDRAEAEMLKQASPMHDIGKVAIPDSILNKPGRFTAEERAVMERHAELGYKMTNSSDRPLLKTAAIVAYEHHEKWDGTGYPRGLKGEEIHIYGRITALADVFDALGSDRVYKKAWDDDRIFNLFKEERGKHFDPKLVDAFFDNLDEILEVREKFKDEYQEVVKQEVTNENSVTVLGAYGSRLKGFGTTCIQLNKSNVIDAGNLIDTIGESSAEIENIWLTHSHLDHILDIAHIIDNYFTYYKKPINIHGLKGTIEALQKNFFNNVIWPDFSKIKMHNSDEMCVKYTEIEFDKTYTLSENENITPFRTDHTVPSCGYVYKKNNSGIMITSDTFSLDRALEIVNSDMEITTAIIECSFESDMQKLAIDSKHLTPKLLSEKLAELKRDDITIRANHLKPLSIQKITKEIDIYCAKWGVRALKDKEIVNF